MSFTKALYYPEIDIANEDWLRTAVLFWDEINTIVPASMRKPYRNPGSEFLADAGVLKPVFVESHGALVQELEEDVLRYLDSNAGAQLLSQGRRCSRRNEYYIHQDKMSVATTNYLKKKLTDGGWLQVPDNFGEYYMTLLANKICDEKSIALLADDMLVSKFTDEVRLDNHRTKKIGIKFHPTPINLDEGLLINLVVKGLRVNPGIPLEKLLRFKEEHRVQLGSFRSNLSRLVQSVSLNGPLKLEAIQNKIEAIYRNDFLPELDELQAELKELAQCSTDSALQHALPVVLGAAAISFFNPLIGAVVLFASAGLSLSASRIAYNAKRNGLLRTNSSSYVLTINKEMGAQ